MTEKSRRLKALFEAPEILILPGVFDGYSVRLMEQMGFAAASISGAGVSESHLGWADKGVMSFKDNLEACRALAACTDLPLMADGDTGYGNAVSVYFTVRAFEDAGLSGLMIEDQVWPKRCGHMAGKAVIPAEEMVQKVKAAVDARRDGDFIIRARTDAAGPLGIDAAIERLNLYAEAGADILFADALLTAEDIEKAARNVPKPLSVNMGLGIRSRPTTPLIHPKRLQEMGVHCVSYPRLLTTAAVKGMMNAMAAFNEMLAGDEPVDRPDLLVSFGELNALTGFDELEKMDEKYAVSPTVGQAAE
jgi:2-methylisocitrate lyase-like PEP mutase family enzyme